MANKSVSSNQPPRRSAVRKWLWVVPAVVLWIALLAWLKIMFWDSPREMEKYFAWQIGDTISCKDDTKVIFQNWGGQEVSFDYRWTRSHKASISFRLDQVDKNRRCTLTFTATSLGEQPIALSLNEQPVGRMNFYGSEAVQAVSFDSGLLSTRKLNVLTLEIPNARQPGTTDTRTLGLALKSLKIEYSDK